jgi:oligoendopeptidase F
MAEGIRNREEVPVQDRWAVEAVYPSDEAWEADFAATAQFAASFSRRSGTLGTSISALRAAIEELLEQTRAFEKLFVYASMKSDEDLSDSHYSEMQARGMSRFTEVRAAQSFFVPELLAIEPGLIGGWLQTADLADYVSWLEDTLRYRRHTLSDVEEKLLAMAGEVAQGYSTAFGKLSNVDMPARLPEVIGEDGGNVRITNANLTSLLECKDSRVRRDVFTGFYRELNGNTSTSAALLDGNVRSDIFFARARKYPSALESSLFSDRVDLTVYESLIKAVHDNLPAMHRYYALKKRTLGLGNMHIYDIYLPAMHIEEHRYSFDEAVEMTLEAVKPLGPDYSDALAEGFLNRWVDRYENLGKRSGAYSGGCYDTWPYILHNFTGTLDSVFTLAHEAGHSMHSLLSRKSQPYHTSDYRILLAEVASTTNEMLLLDLLLNRAADPGEEAYLIDHLINDFRGTVFRQTMFAEFEWAIHREVEKGGALTTDFLSGEYLRLVRQYHGPSFDFDSTDELIATEWARIPHFYYNFYVYKYATGLSSAVDISTRILANEGSSVADYLAFLSSGSCKPPLDLLADTGVDLRTPAPVSSALGYLAKLVGKLEKLLG